MPHDRDELPFQLDHIIALKHDGPTSPDNLALSCYACNIHKGPNVAGIDRDTREVVPLFHPRRDRWDDHFMWQGAKLVGRTPTGRATVAVLAMNLPHRRALRESLITEGAFP